MEQLNRVELIGHIGSISINRISGNLYGRFSVATSYAYKSKDGTPVIDTTWHNVLAWQEQGTVALESLTRGDAVHVVGRIRVVRCTTESGADRVVTEVIASKVEKVAGDSPIPQEG